MVICGDGVVPRTFERRADALGQIGEWFLAYADAPGRRGHGAAASKVLITVDRIALDDDERTLTDAKRFFTGKTRELLEIRDRGCAFPGCTIPAGWCDAHHIRPCSQGGPTSVDNGVLLCRFHHGIVHHSPWDIRYDQHHRLPAFLPPPELDPARTPLHNHRTCPAAVP